MISFSIAADRSIRLKVVTIAQLRVFKEHACAQRARNLTARDLAGQVAPLDPA
jgi:hypothetical protein